MSSVDLLNIGLVTLAGNLLALYLFLNMIGVSIHIEEQEE